MIDSTFHIHEHPIIGFSLMLSCISASVIVNFLGMVQDVVPLFQLAAYLMTLYVGYRTVKNLGDKK